MEKIDAVIVVEGKHDSEKLKKFFDVDTIETSGSHLSKETLNLIKGVALKRKVILLLDPDSVGEKIRTIINQEIKGLVNCFVLKKDAKTHKKVGIEHADYNTLKIALENFLIYGESKESLKYQDMLELGLSGNENSSSLRMKVSEYFHLGKCNSKTMLKRLNMLGINKKKIKEIL